MTDTPNDSYSILLVDDEPFVRQLTARLLTSIGFSAISEASNGHEALKLIDSTGGSFDIIFCDLMMPDMDGIEFVRHLSELKDPPAIAFLSGAEAAILRAAKGLALARRLNVLGTILKPAKIPDIERALTNFDEDSRPRSRRSVPDITESDLARAIEADELIFHYQPKVAIPSRSLNSVEALVRWKHPKFGLVFPDAFVALAESGPLITPMTEKLVEIAVRQLAAWKADRLETRVAVNLSPSMLSDVTLPERLVSLTTKYGVPAEQVVLEITETGVAEDEAIYLEIVTRLHMKGFEISIDDFGTGSSSLSKLEAMPFGELKIDRAFVDGAHADPTKSAILKASINLAKSLNLKTIAEGVELEEDWKLLHELGCDIVQGYFVAKPMPPEDLSDWVRKWASREALP